jgi:hypothetical protein
MARVTGEGVARVHHRLEASWQRRPGNRPLSITGSRPSCHRTSLEPVQQSRVGASSFQARIDACTHATTRGAERATSMDHTTSAP